MPNDLIYHTYLGDDGRPKIDEGPLLRAGENLSVFFFNEINRARPQVHALMLRVMAERHVSAFKKEYRLPHMIVFADRNQVEKNETFEIPSAARDRFMMEIPIEIPTDRDMKKSLVFNTKFQNAEKLTQQVESGILHFDQLNAFSEQLQNHIKSSDVLEEYALDLWDATQPVSYTHLDVYKRQNLNSTFSGACGDRSGDIQNRRRRCRPSQDLLPSGQSGRGKLLRPCRSTEINL